MSPDLKTGTTFAILTSFGTNPVYKDKLMRWCRGVIINGAISLSSLVEIQSAPALDFGFKALQIFSMSISEISICRFILR